MKKIIVLVLSLLLIVSLTVPAFAVNFVPSAEVHEEPHLDKVVDKDGNEADAIIEDKDGNQTAIISNSILQIVLTPAADKGEAIVSDITQYLVEAEYQIANANDVSELTDTMVSSLVHAKEQTTDPELKNVSMEDLVVRDLFDVSLVRDEKYIEQIKEGETISFAVKTDLTKDDMFFVLLNCGGDEWKVVQNLQLDENGVLTITVDSLCAIAIVTGRGNLAPVDPTKPVSPQTGDKTPVFYAVGIALSALTTVYFFKKAKKTAGSER